MGCVGRLLGIGVSVGMFLALMAFHMIYLVAVLSLSVGIVLGIALGFSYLTSRSLGIWIENFMSLTFLSLMSKYHLIFYYKLIYPGDNYHTPCWSLLRKVTKLIYAAFTCFAFVEIIRLYYSRRLDPVHHVSRTTLISSTNILDMFWVMWEDDNKYFLTSMAVLVHLFAICLYEDYSLLCKNIPFFDVRSIFALLVSVVLQGIYFMVFSLEFYLVHSWISWTVIQNNLTWYSVLTQLSLIFWLIQVTLVELMSEKFCALLDKNEAPYFWFQNMSRGRVILLKYILLPLCIYLFWTDWDLTQISFLKFEDNSNQIIVFMSFFCTTILHALKTLMLLKNGLARFVYGCWICYFNLYDFMFCCDDDDDDDLSDISPNTTTLSNMTLDNKSNASKKDRDPHDDRRTGYPPPTPINRNNFGDHHRKGNNSEGDLQLPKHIVVMASGGIGDSQWTPQEFPQKNVKINSRNDDSHSGQSTINEQLDNNLRVKSFTSLLE